MARKSKGPIVKRNKKIYSNTKREKKQRLYKVIGIIAACAIMLFIGYSAVGPVKKFLDGDFNKKPEKEIEETSTSEILSESSDEDEIEKEEEVVIGKLDDIKGVYVPVEIMKNPDGFDAYLDDLKKKGYNAIVFNLKDPNGFIHYKSGLESVLLAESMAVDPLELEYLLKKAQEKEIILIPRIFAFSDPVASRRLGDAFVRYGSPDGVTWLDNSLNNGGKAWFSPEKPIAQKYITDIVKEISDAGFETIMLDGVQYPMGLSLDKAYFGERSKTDKLGVLNDFLVNMKEQVKNNTEIILVNSSENLVLGDDAMYGGNPGGLNVGSRIFSIFPSRIKAPVKIGEEVILESPVEDIKKTTEVMITEAVKNLSVKDGQKLVFIQYFDGFENGDYQKQIDALDDNIVNGFVLYNEQGLYK